VKCKNCHKNISEAEGRKVADWVFCRDCFDKLMSKPVEENDRKAPDAPATEQAAVSSAAPEAACHICGRRLETGRAKKVGSWTFCSTCHADLVHRSPPAVSINPADGDRRPQKRQSASAAPSPPLSPVPTSSDYL